VAEEEAVPVRVWVPVAEEVEVAEAVAEELEVPLAVPVCT
jgi:hypothetical protein